MKGVLREAWIESGSPSATFYRRPDLGLWVLRVRAGQPVLPRDLPSSPEGWREVRCASVAPDSGHGTAGCRRTIIGNDRDDPADALAGACPSLRPPDPSGRTTAAFMFTGQGSQHPQMGRRLYLCSPTFKSAFDRCCDLFEPSLARPLRDLLWRSDAEAELDHTSNAQPAIFALGYAAAQMWLGFGLRPSHLIGHSIGEITAACLAGVYSLPDAVELVAQRALHMGRLPAGGAMVAVKADVERVGCFFGSRGPDVGIAAVNGRRNVVVSGPEDAVAELAAAFEESGISCQRLAVSHAFHSPLMEPALDPFEKAIDHVKSAPPAVPFLSNVSGGFHPAAAAPGPHYWRTHIRSPVLFAANLEAAAQDGCRVFLELGARPILSQLAKRLFRSADIEVIPPPDLADDPAGEFARAIEILDEHGHGIDWDQTLEHVAALEKVRS